LLKTSCQLEVASSLLVVNASTSYVHKPPPDTLAALQQENAFFYQYWVAGSDAFLTRDHMTTGMNKMGAACHYGPLPCYVCSHDHF
jgi:hypothetical protein